MLLLLQSLQKFAAVADVAADAAVADVAVVVVVGAHDLCPTRQSRATQRNANQLNSTRAPLLHYPSPCFLSQLKKMKYLFLK